MLESFLHWYVAQWRAMLPEALRGDAADGRPTLIVTQTADSWRATIRTRGRAAATTVGVFPADDSGAAALRRALPAGVPAGGVIFVPGADALLEREVPLPLAAERDAERVLAYEMDRLTPFAAADVFWTWRVMRRDRAAGRLALRLSLVPRAPIADALAALGRAGLAPARMEANGRSILLMRSDPRIVRRRQRLRTGLAVACGVVAVMIVAVPFLRQALARAALDAKVEQLQPHVREAEQIRRRILDAEGGADVVQSERAHVGDPLRVLAILTDLLPDDTWLSDFGLHHGQVQIAGQSAAAAKLIPALAAEPGLRNPAFTAPVTRLDAGGADAFTIRAEIAP